MCLSVPPDLLTHPALDVVLLEHVLLTGHVLLGLGLGQDPAHRLSVTGPQAVVGVMGTSRFCGYNLKCQLSGISNYQLIMTLDIKYSVHVLPNKLLSYLSRV